MTPLKPCKLKDAPSYEQFWSQPNASEIAAKHYAARPEELSAVRFNCALSKVEKQTLRYQRLKEWHLWFAWKPVRIKCSRSGLWKWVWLEFVSRRWIPIDPQRDARLALWSYDFPSLYP